MSENSERQLLRVVRELCREQNYTLSTYSGDWILELNGKKRIVIVGYKFPNNAASASELCDDKSALYAALSRHGVDAVPHFFFMSPDESHFIGSRGNWAELESLLKRYGKLVLKPNAWSGGEDCALVRDEIGLERETQRLFQKYRSIAASPYLEIEDEFRIVVLNGAAELVYRKARPFVTGDGSRTLWELAREKGEIRTDAELDLRRVPEKDERVYLQWKHNLGQGAEAITVGDGAEKEALSDFALKAARVAGVRFASVDLVSVGGKLFVLEINSGVKMENFARKNADNYAIAKGIYRKAIESL